MLAQLSSAEIQLNNLRAEGNPAYSEVLNIPYHPEWLLEPTLQDLASTTAAKYGVDPVAIQAVMGCESHWNIAAVGDFGTSFGLSQIHLPAHPDITKAEALDPIFSMNYMAQEFAKGKANLWTCARELGVS